jgi:hypothetical protein
MKPSFIFSSNSIRLSLVNWICVLIILILMLSLLPVIWHAVEKFEPSDDYRVPYELSNDYWMIARWCKYANSNYPIVMIGDSVVWGQYVGMRETLPYYLNELENGNSINNGQKSPLIPLSRGKCDYQRKDTRFNSPFGKSNDSDSPFGKGGKGGFKR